MDWKKEQNRIYWEDGQGKLLAEATFLDCGENTVQIIRTYVDEYLRGRGVAGELMLAAVEYLREKGKKVEPVCSYALHWFESHPEYGNLLASGKEKS